MGKNPIQSTIDDDLREQVNEEKISNGKSDAEIVKESLQARYLQDPEDVELRIADVDIDLRKLWSQLDKTIEKRILLKRNADKLRAQKEIDKQYTTIIMDLKKESLEIEPLLSSNPEEARKRLWELKKEMEQASKTGYTSYVQVTRDVGCDKLIKNSDDYDLIGKHDSSKELIDFTKAKRGD